MAGALLECWLDKNYPAHFTILTPTITQERYAGRGKITTINSPDELAGKSFNMVQIGIKPQKFDDILPEITPYITDKNTIITSIAAGKSMQTLDHFFKGHPICRIMPNTPVKLGKGISGACKNAKVSQNYTAALNELYSLNGEVIWCEEEDFDALTPISGSGPAYLFYFIEALTQTARNNGFDEKTALKLARQTIIGAAALAEQENETPPQTLRRNVTSPGGVTEAALNRLMDGEFQKILDEAIARGIKRNQEL